MDASSQVTSRTKRDAEQSRAQRVRGAARRDVRCPRLKCTNASCYLSLKSSIRFDPKQKPEVPRAVGRYVLIILVGVHFLLIEEPQVNNNNVYYGMRVPVSMYCTVRMPHAITRNELYFTALYVCSCDLCFCRSKTVARNVFSCLHDSSKLRSTNMNRVVSPLE